MRSSYHPMTCTPRWRGLRSHPLGLWILCCAAACASPPRDPGPELPPATERTVLVVRHAERADDGTQRDPELSAVGRRRAEALAEALAHAGVGHIVVTQFQRTRQTAQPLADLADVAPQVVEFGRGGLEAHVAAVLAAVAAAPPDRVVLVVGHSNTVPAIVRGLSGRPAPPMGEDEYGTLYVVTLPPTGPAQGPARLLRASWSTPGA